MNGYEKLGGVIGSRMQNVSAAGKDTTVSLGTVRGSLSIEIDGLDWVLPRGDYMISQHLQLPEELTTEITEGHLHKVKMQTVKLKVGDRVVIVWVGSEAIVIDIVKNS
jgi:hypothetical protein